MSNEDTIKAIEANIKEAKKFVAVADALERLESNRDFKLLIGDGYFTREAVRLVHLKADPSMQKDENQKSIVSQMDAIGSLSQFFVAVRQQANLARKAIEADEQTIEDINGEA